MSSATTSTTTCSSSAILGTREDSTNAPPFSTIMRGRRRTSGSSGLPRREGVFGLTGHGRTGVGDGYPKAKIRPNEDGKVYNFAQSGRLSGNPGYLKSEAVAYPSELLP